MSETILLTTLCIMLWGLVLVSIICVICTIKGKQNNGGYGGYQGKTKINLSECLPKRVVSGVKRSPDSDGGYHGGPFDPDTMELPKVKSGVKRTKLARYALFVSPLEEYDNMNRFLNAVDRHIDEVMKKRTR